MDSTTYWQAMALLLTPLVLWASWIDYKERRVPNWLNATIAVLGCVMQGIWFGWSGLTTGLLGGLAGLGLLIVPWLAYMMGAGDVKLLAAAGVWFGPVLIFWGFAIGAVIAALVSIVMIAWARRWSVACEHLHLATIKCTNPKLIFSELGSVKSLGSKGQLIPYGVPLTAGMLIVLGLRLCQVW